MGDIALPNINYDTQWHEMQQQQQQRFNKSFQQELERMKQEVYHEGLQVEEEGLTDIVRKKTKLPAPIDFDTNVVPSPPLSRAGIIRAKVERRKYDPLLVRIYWKIICTNKL